MLSVRDRSADVGRGAPLGDALTTQRLATAGACAGPLFVVVVVAQLATDPNFDLAHQPLSLLALGDHGWVQVANFILTGLLAWCLAVTVHRSWAGGAGGRWGPLLLAVFGVGLVAGGLFLPDAALGYPAGTPDRIPADFSWHGTLHALAPPVAFTALVGACLIAGRRFRGSGRRWWAAYSVATGLASLILSVWPSPDTASVRLAVASLLGFCWTTALAVHLRRVTPAVVGPDDQPLSS